jgi:asparagine synthase (glutamine-hydrolysing)
LKIKLLHNKGYKWIDKDGTFVKGYIFDETANFYSEEKLLIYFKEVDSFDAFIKKLKGANGLFSIVIQRKNEIWAAVDRIRMFPVFYNFEGISDKAKSICNKPSIDQEAGADFLQTAFVTSNRTLLDDVYQIQAGEAICIKSNENQKEFYSSFTSTYINPKSIAALKSELKVKLESAFNTVFDQLENKTIVIPLSAGYDSRLIAVMLKNRGFKDVICFTYGRKAYPEITTSKAVAEQLGFKWHYIEYNQELITGFLQDKTFQEFYQFSANHVSMFYLQEYFAIKQLKEKQDIPEDAVFISGHSGDFIAGSHLDGHIKPDASLRKIAEEIFQRNFGLLPYPSKFKSDKLKTILTEFENINSLSHSLYENWDLMERQAKFIVNSCNTYNFFGYQHFLPFWDAGLLEFFKGVPYKLKLNKKLYDEVLQSYFEPHHLNFENEFQPGSLQLLVQKQKDKVKKFIPDKLYQHKFLQNDPLCYWEATREMIKDMEDRGIEINHQYKELKSVFTQWYLSKLLS